MPIRANYAASSSDKTSMQKDKTLDPGERVLEAEVLGDHLPNVMVDNNDRLLGPGARRLLDGILNGWPVNNREQRFGNNAGRWTHPSASPRCWNQGNIDAHVVTFSSVPLAIR